MISIKLSRAAHRAVTSPSATPVTTCASSHCLHASARPASHQRRNSSSKTSSCPPDSTAGGKPAPGAKVAAQNQNGGAPAEEQTSAQRSSKGRARAPYTRKGNSSTGAKDVGTGPVDQFAGLPSVPSTQGMDAKDLSLSSFFSLHRPISLKTTLPPPSTSESFDTIFQSRPQLDSWHNGNSAERRPEDVIYTLHKTIESLEDGASENQDDGMRWEVVHESPSNKQGNVKHLDGPPPMKSLDELVAQFKPFQPPPPPQKFPEEKKAAARKASGRQRKPKQKVWETRIRITESTSSDGQINYSATPSPLVRLQDEAEDKTQHPANAIRDPTPARHPFLTRMRQRENRVQRVQASSGMSRGIVRRAPAVQRQERIKMHLISVKRQRKLKMKKHKYKKLLKRTRTLRRRLDRT